MIVRFMFLVIMLIVCAILINMFLNNKFDILDTQAEIIIGGLIYGSGGVSYFDPVTGRHYPEIIDVQQLESAKLDIGMFYLNNNMVTAKISVSPVKFKGTTVPLKTVYYNKEFYDNIEPLIGPRRLSGIGGFNEYKKSLPVILRDYSGKLDLGYVEYRIIQPRAIKR
jgi:hypothetical protein